MKEFTCTAYLTIINIDYNHKWITVYGEYDSYEQAYNDEYAPTEGDNEECKTRWLRAGEHFSAPVIYGI